MITKAFFRLMTWQLVLLMALSPVSCTQKPAPTPGPASVSALPPPTPPPPPPESVPAQAKIFSQEELDQMLAPIALYPDSLLAQILMASTYPLELVQAERWVKANASLQGDALALALEQQSWDPSVKSLVNFPQVLTMMNEKLDWTQKLGDAFLAQQLLGGFALIAYPANYHSTGVMTFMVNHEGQVYQKDLGEKTEEVAQAIATFDPDSSWQKVEEKIVRGQ